MVPCPQAFRFKHMFLLIILAIISTFWIIFNYVRILLNPSYWTKFDLLLFLITIIATKEMIRRILLKNGRGEIKSLLS